MILTGPEIERQVAAGAIVIDPFLSEHLNPNSYNYRLAPRLKVCRSREFDMKKQSEWETVEIPESGLRLMPHRLYLGSTVERLGSAKFVTSLIGRSSLGRLGLFLTASADLGNLGYAHRWTLELSVVQPLVVYPAMKIGQVSFWSPVGAVGTYCTPYTEHDLATPAILSRVNERRA